MAMPAHNRENQTLPIPPTGPLRKFLRPDEVSAIYSLPKTSLEKWRSLKKGPPYHKCGKHVLYKPLEVEKWIENQMIQTIE